MAPYLFIGRVVDPIQQPLKCTPLSLQDKEIVRKFCVLMTHLVDLITSVDKNIASIHDDAATSPMALLSTHFSAWHHGLQACLATVHLNT